MAQTISFYLNIDQDVELFIQKQYPGLLFKITAKSLDARALKKNRLPQFHYQVELFTQNELHSNMNFPQLGTLPEKPIIIGSGPAGLFCALRLLEYGITSCLLERGSPAKERMLKIAAFWKRGILDVNDNVCFGEGGAGLFSDGKLTTRIKSEHREYVLEKLVEFGAPTSILYDKEPHVGSEKIRKILIRITNYLKVNGCEIIYNQPVQEILFEQNKVQGVCTAQGKKIFSPLVILATGHSATDIYEHLQKKQVSMKAKDFAVGIRVEHPRNYIDQLQYRQQKETLCTLLGSARYRLSFSEEETKRGTYSFCMCPGGYVLSSGTEKDGLVSNGMSNSGCNSPWSNAAIVAEVKVEDFLVPNHLLAGIEFQRKIEKDFFELSQRLATGRELPAMLLTDFLQGKISGKSLPISSSPSGIIASNIAELFPPFLLHTLQRSLQEFERKLPGFLSPHALVFGPETRTSSPLTIVRDKETLQSVSHQGLYPCGEGAGYAGGITSAAVDGVKVALSILKETKNYQEVIK